MLKNSILNCVKSQPMKPKILAFAGSTSADSFNKKLVKIAAAARINLAPTVRNVAMIGLK